MGLLHTMRGVWRHGSRPAARVAARQRTARRLTFEHCEQRLTLSTAAGSLADYAGGPALDDEGGTVAFESYPSFSSGDFDATPSWRAAFTSVFEATVAGDRLSLLGDGAGEHAFQFILSSKLGEKVQSVFSGAGLQVNRNAFDRLDEPTDNYDVWPSDSELSLTSEGSLGWGALYEANRPGSQVDNLGEIVRVLPIAPPDGATSPNEGGPIAVTAFAGLSPLGLPASAPSALASREWRASESGLDHAVSPAKSAPADGLRGRAVVYEVAHADERKVEAEGKTTAIGDQLPTAMAAGSTSSAGRHDVVAMAAKTASQRPHFPHQEVPASQPIAKAPAAQVMGDHPARRAASRVDAASRAAEGTAAWAAVDAAFAEDAADGSDESDNAGAAAFADKHQRHILGLAAAMVIGAGPLNRFLKRRAGRELVEQLTPQRRWLRDFPGGRMTR